MSRWRDIGPPRTPASGVQTKTQAEVDTLKATDSSRVSPKPAVRVRHGLGGVVS